MGYGTDEAYDRRGINATYHRRRAARAVWATGGRLEEASARARTGLLTLRKWLQTPEFRALLAEEAIEPLVQAATAVVRWAPAAVARLIRDLDSESPNDARRAARDILRLAMEVQKHLLRAETQRRKEEASEPPGASSAAPPDPLTARLEALSEEEMEEIWRILNRPASAECGVQSAE